MVLGFFGAHHFYLGHNRDGFRYLLYTLAGLLLMAVAVPIAKSSAFSSGFGGVVVALFLLAGGLGVIAAIYAQALLDAIRILTGSLAP
ncbi:NINE protein [Hymenobacter monticola]|uniref:NINE protein n=1 Tax=Hymenobacter monticola TaxID=1705399 RepID=A0ABY4BB41_9BACT|nr:NINE protein [Hymenobacter monticola]